MSDNFTLLVAYIRIAREPTHFRPKLKVFRAAIIAKLPVETTAPFKLIM
jgi:hypothetical protein